jgi:hypothetical protein
VAVIHLTSLLAAILHLTSLLLVCVAVMIHLTSLLLICVAVLIHPTSLLLAVWLLSTHLTSPLLACVAVARVPRVSLQAMTCLARPGCLHANRFESNQAGHVLLVSVLSKELIFKSDAGWVIFCVTT